MAFGKHPLSFGLPAYIFLCSGIRDDYKTASIFSELVKNTNVPMANVKKFQKIQFLITYIKR